MSLLDLMKQGRCKEISVNFKDYPSNAHKALEEYITIEANKILFNPTPEKLKELKNFVECFKLKGGKIEKLGSSVYPEWFDLCFRIWWFSQDKEYLKEECVYSITEFNKSLKKFTETFYKPVNELVENKVNLQKTDGMTHLFIALKNSQDTEINTLLNKSKINVNLPDKHGFTPLMLAVASDSSKLIAKLIEKGADINAQDIGGHTALMAAISANAQNAFEKLLAYGANAKIKTNVNETILMIAAKLNRSEILSNIMKNFPEMINMKDNTENTALMWAASFGNGVAIWKLLSKGAKPNEKNIDGYTALMVAAQKGFDMSAWILIINQKGFNYKIDINSQNNKGNTALMLAALNNHPGVISLLLNYDANPKIKNKAGKTAADLSTDPIMREMLILAMEEPRPSKGREPRS